MNALCMNYLFSVFCICFVLIFVTTKMSSSRISLSDDFRLELVVKSTNNDFLAYRVVQNDIPISYDAILHHLSTHSSEIVVNLISQVIVDSRFEAVYFEW